MTENSRRAQMKQPNNRLRWVKRIDVLPDDVLLEIFDHYVGILRPWYEGKRGVESWQPLVHVCRRWRTLVLVSPRRLNLQLCCTPKTPAKDSLDIWPPYPLVVLGNMLSSRMDNIIAALGHSNRVCEVDLFYFADWQLAQVLAAMQVPFPELTALELWSNDETVHVIPDSFLDGSAPRLRSLNLDAIPFPGLPKLLLSATHLVELRFTGIPHPGYISPEAILAPISVLSSLETFFLGFESPQYLPDRESRRPLPSKHSVPTLTHLSFSGDIEYLEDFVTCIDAPQLERMDIKFYNQIDLDTPRLAQFINRAPKIGKRDAAVLLRDKFAHIGLNSPGILDIKIICSNPDSQLSSIEQVCNSLYTLSTVEQLCLKYQCVGLVWKDDAIENTLWSQLLLPFTAVTDIYLSTEFAPGIAAALQELDERRITEVLPSLQNIFVKGLEPSGPFQENIGQFVAARQLSGNTITISDWNADGLDTVEVIQPPCKRLAVAQFASRLAAHFY